MQTVIIGSGNTATVLGRLIKNAGHEIRQVFSRNIAHAHSLAEELGCAATDDWPAIEPDAELYLIALSDSALAGLHQNFTASRGIVVHTAGAVPQNALRNVAANYGVLYPLQSLRKERLTYNSVPLLTDANTAENLGLLTEFAESLSGTVRRANDEQRMHLHVSAVVANNFSNYLYLLTEDYCKKNGAEFNLLQPLILETAERLKDFAPGTVQTGPAARHDMATIDRHVQLLNDFPELQQFYQLFTLQILKAF